MNKQEFTKQIQENEGLNLRDKKLVKTGRWDSDSRALPVAIEIWEDIDWRGNKRNRTRFIVQGIDVDNNGNIVLGRERALGPREVHSTFGWDTVGDLADKITDKRTITNLYHELRDNSAWSLDPSDFDSEYSYRENAREALENELRQAIRVTGMVTSDRPLVVSVGDHVRVSFTMTLAEAKALLNQKVGV